MLLKSALDEPIVDRSGSSISNGSCGMSPRGTAVSMTARILKALQLQYGHIATDDPIITVVAAKGRLRRGQIDRLRRE